MDHLETIKIELSIAFVLGYCLFFIRLYSVANHHKESFEIPELNFWFLILSLTGFLLFLIAIYHINDIGLETGTSKRILDFSLGFLFAIGWFGIYLGELELYEKDHYNPIVSFFVLIAFLTIALTYREVSKMPMVKWGKFQNHSTLMRRKIKKAKNTNETKTLRNSFIKWLEGEKDSIWYSASRRFAILSNLIQEYESADLSENAKSTFEELERLYKKHKKQLEPGLKIQIDAMRERF